MPETGAVGTKLKVFISYSRKDLAFAEGIVTALEALGLTPTIDTRDLPKLEDWRRELLGFIREADAVVFIISSHSISSPVCAWEIEQVVKLNKRLAPIVLEPVPDDRIPDAIAKINYIFFDQANDFAMQAGVLAKALQTDLIWIKEHTRLGELAHRWDEQKKASGLLLRGQELQDAERWIASRPRGAPEPSELHREFIRESRRGTTRRQRLTLAGSVAAAVVGFGLAGIAFWQREIAVEQEKIAQVQRDAAEKARNEAEEQRDASDLVRDQLQKEKDRTTGALDVAFETANQLITDFAAELDDSPGVPPNITRDVLKKSLQLEAELATFDQIETNLNLKRRRAESLGSAGRLLLKLNDTEGAIDALKKSHEIWKNLVFVRVHDLAWQGEYSGSINSLGDAMLRTQNYAEAQTYYEESLDLLRSLFNQTNNSELERRIAYTLSSLGAAKLLRGDPHGASANFNESVAIFCARFDKTPDAQSEQDLSSMMKAINTAAHSSFKCR
jgi:tetratricopeptide (TPR) repeat protein